MSKATFQHLRIPFSYFLLPIFLFAVSQSSEIYWYDTLLAFVSIHLFLYPASNGYNSYFDKDQESIGGLEFPPTVSKELYYYSILFDGISICIGFLISLEFAAMVFIYGLASKAYSHPSTRLKKYAFGSWILTGFFQGFFMYFTSIHAISKIPLTAMLTPEQLIPAVLSSAMLMGSYPMTQIYQHGEDARRGDFTLSRLLGIRGTFMFTLNFFGLAAIGFISYFLMYHSFLQAAVFICFLLPVLGYFLWWMLRSYHNPQEANFKNTMRLNMISGHCLNACFVSLIILSRMI